MLKRHLIFWYLKLWTCAKIQEKIKHRANINRLRQEWIDGKILRFICDSMDSNVSTREEEAVWRVVD